MKKELEEDYSNSAIAISKIAAQFGVEPKVIRRIVNSFFSRYGIKLFMFKGDTIRVRGLGKFVPINILGKTFADRTKKVKILKRRRMRRKKKQ